MYHPLHTCVKGISSLFISGRRIHVRSETQSSSTVLPCRPSLNSGSRVVVVPETSSMISLSDRGSCVQTLESRSNHSAMSSFIGLTRYLQPGEDVKHVVNAAIGVRIFLMKLSPVGSGLLSMFPSGDRVRSNAFLIVFRLTDVLAVDRQVLAFFRETSDNRLETEVSCPCFSRFSWISMMSSKK